MPAETDLSDQQRAILTAYAAGSSPTDVAKDLGIDRPTVRTVINDWARFDPDRARALLAGEAAPVTPSPAAAKPAPAPKKPTGRPAGRADGAAAARAADLAVAASPPAPEPDPEPSVPAGPARPDMSPAGLALLFRRAEAVPDPQVRALAADLAAVVQRLTVVVTAAEVVVAEAKVAALREQLTAAERELNQLRAKGGADGV